MRAATRWLILVSLTGLSPGSAGAEDTPAPPPDDTLEQIKAAAEADAQARKQAQGADATAAEDRRAEDPLRLLLGKETVGNESNPSISIILDVSGAAFSESERLPQEGHAPAGSGISVTGVELAGSASIDPYFKFDLAFCFNHLELEEAFVTTLALPGNLQARGGRFLSRVGRHNNTHPHGWRFVLPPLPNQFLVGAEGLSAPGVELSWLAPLPWYLEVIGALQVGGGGAFGPAEPAEGQAPGNDLDFLGFLYPLRLVQFFDLSDDWALQLGVNALFGPAATGPGSGPRARAYGGDLFLKWRPIGWGETGYTFLSLLLEGWYREMESPTGLWCDAGGYADLVFGITKRWEAGLRGEVWRRTCGVEPDAANQRAGFGLDAARASLALSFLPSHFSRLRLQYAVEQAEGFGLNHIGLLQLEVSAGAHGAHAY